LAFRAVLSTSSAVVWAVIVRADAASVSSVSIRFIVLVDLVSVCKGTKISIKREQKERFSFVEREKFIQKIFERSCISRKKAEANCHYDGWPPKALKGLVGE
jgi:hypothetical protein